MTTLSVPPSLQSAVEISESSWQSDLQTLFHRSKDRFPDILWEFSDEDDNSGKGPEEVWGHKAMIYARAPPSFQARYFQFRPPPISSPNPYSTTPSVMPAQSALSLNLGIDYPVSSRSPSPFRALSPAPSTAPGGLLRLSLSANQGLFSNELEFLYTGKGLGDAFEFLFDSAGDREENDAEESRLDKLRKDLVFMWRSRLYSDVRIALTGNFSSTNHESATAMFSSHRFMLVTRSPYFYTSLLQWGKTSVAAKAVNGEEPLTITLPSPPFTPASLHFTLGYIYTGTLVFSHRTYDLDTAFHIMRSATYLSIQSLYDEVQARIVQEMMHGLYHAFLEFEEYDRITGGKWGSGGCRCRQCARRAPRVLEFAISEDVKNPHMERGARRALVGLYGEGWCTSEFAKLPEKTRMSLVKGLGKRTTPINIFPLLFATHHALKKLNNVLDSWADSVREMVLTARKKIDEVLCRLCDECFEQHEWIEFMIDDGARFEDAEKIEWVMDAVKRGLDEKNAGLVYQTLVSSILLRPHLTEREQTMLSSTSHVRVQVEQTRMDVARWLRKRWIGVKQECGFDSLDSWALKEISHEIEVSVDELVNADLSETSPKKGSPSRKTVVEEPDTGSMHSLSASVLNRNAHKQRSGTPTKREPLVSSSASVRSVARSTLSTTSRATTSPRRPYISSASRPDSKLTPAPSTRSSILSTDTATSQQKKMPVKRLVPSSVTGNSGEKPNSSAASVRSFTSTARKVPLPTNNQATTSTLRPKSGSSLSRPNSQLSNTSDGSTTFKTARSDAPSSSSSTSPSRSRTVSTSSNVSTVSAKTARTSAALSSLSTPPKSVTRVRRSSVGSRTSTISVKVKRPATTSSTTDRKTPSPTTSKRAPSITSVRSSVSTTPSPSIKKTIVRKVTPSSAAVRKSTASVISTRTKTATSTTPSSTTKSTKTSSEKLAESVQTLDVQRRGSSETIRQSIHPDVQPRQTSQSPDLPKGATLEIGIPCIISSKRARFRAFARYIGEVEGELGPWVGVEVPMNESWTGTGNANSVDDRQWNDGTWGGIKYFDIGSASAEWDYGDERARRRRFDMSSSWTMTGGSSFKTSGTKRDGDHLTGPDYRMMKRMRSSSPTASENSSMETRGLFVRPQQVLYVVDAVGSDL